MLIEEPSYHSVGRGAFHALGLPAGLRLGSILFMVGPQSPFVNCVSEKHKSRQCAPASAKVVIEECMRGGILTILEVMKRWGFTYKTNIVWHKIRKDGGPDGRGVGFYFRNVTELILFGTRGSLRTAAPGRRQVNFLATRKREHSRKPDEIYPIIEACSYGPFVELFARHSRPGWDSWGNEVDNSAVSRADREEQALINPMYV
jgi:hypothetical protein